MKIFFKKILYIYAFQKDKIAIYKVHDELIKTIHC